jgi:hypothetical protein
MARTSQTGETTVKQYTFGIRTLSRLGHDPAAGLLSKADHEEYIRSMVADGWRLMGQPQVHPQMVAYNQEPAAGFNIIYWWERGE